MYYRQSARHISRLSARGVTTTRALIVALPQLPPKLREFGIWWISALKIRSAESVFLPLLYNRSKDRVAGAAASASIGGKRAVREFVRIGQTQLALQLPDFEWLNVIVHGLRYPEGPEAEEIILAIFEREDLPGWLRGNAGHAIGLC